MRKLSEIIREQREMKDFYTLIDVKIQGNVKSTDITNAGEEATGIMDSLESDLKDLGYNVISVGLNEIDTITESINESINIEDETKTEEELLNHSPDQQLEQDVIDIFNVVEKRISNLKDNERERGLNILKKMLEEFAMNDTDFVENEFVEEPVQTVADVVNMIVVDNPSFKWLYDNLNDNSTFDDLKNILQEYGMGNIYYQYV